MKEKIVIVADIIQNNQVIRVVSTQHDPLTKRINHVVSCNPDYKRVVFGFRVSTHLANRVGFALA
jgi:hypothetical protein